MTWQGINYPRPEPKPNPNIELGQSDFGGYYWRCKLCDKGSGLPTHIPHHPMCPELIKQNELRKKYGL